MTSDDERDHEELLGAVVFTCSGENPSDDHWDDLPDDLPDDLSDDL